MSTKNYKFQSKGTKMFKNPNLSSNGQLFNIYGSSDFKSPLKEIDPLERYSRARQGRLQERSRSKSKNGQILSSRISVNSTQSGLVIKREAKFTENGKIDFSSTADHNSRMAFTSGNLLHKLRSIKKQRVNLVGSSLENFTSKKNEFLSSRNLNELSDLFIGEKGEESNRRATEKFEKFRMDGYSATPGLTLNAYSTKQLEKREKNHTVVNDTGEIKSEIRCEAKPNICSSIDNFRSKMYKKSKIKSYKAETPVSTSLSLNHSALKPKGRILLFSNTKKFKKGHYPNFNSSKVLKQKITDTGKRKLRKARNTVNAYSNFVSPDRTSLLANTGNIRRGTYSFIEKGRAKVKAMKKGGGKKKKKRRKKKKKTGKNNSRRMYKINEKLGSKENYEGLANLNQFDKISFTDKIKCDLDGAMDNLELAQLRNLEAKETKMKSKIYIQINKRIDLDEDAINLDESSSSSSDSSEVSATSRTKNTSSNVNQTSDPFTSKSKSKKSRSVSSEESTSSTPPKRNKFDFFKKNKNLYSTDKKVDFKSLSNSVLSDFRENQQRLFGNVTYDRNYTKLQDSSTKLSGAGGKLKPLVYPFNGAEERGSGILSDRVDFRKSSSSKTNSKIYFFSFVY